ncbi:hypothetical protein E4U41_001685 [Claviceps citrina]|nr:hypothetical protein E4U41_001685 [Claviceps citrina]
MNWNTSHRTKVAHCQLALQCDFENQDLCAEAINMATDSMACYSVGGAIRRVNKNDRLAIYGGSIVSAVLCRAWYDRGADKGLSNANLAERGIDRGLDAFVKHEQRC